MAQDTNNIDLFGNSTLTPRQVIQQQLARSVSNTQELYKDQTPVNRAAATWGAGLGGLFRQVLQEKGVIDKDPEVLKAEQSESFRRDTEQKAKEVKVTLDPQNPADWAGKMAAIGLQAIQQTNEDGTPKYPELQDMAPRLMERYIQSQAAQEAARLKAAQVKTEEGKPALQEAQAEEAKAKANKAKAETGEQKFTFVPQFIGDGKWQDMRINQKGQMEPFGKPYTMEQKSKGKGESQSPAWNTGLRALNTAFNFSDLYGLKDPQQLPAYNRGLKLLSDYIVQGVEPLEAASKAASESQVQHKQIMSEIKRLRSAKTPKSDIEKMLKDADLDSSLYLK